MKLEKYFFHMCHINFLGGGEDQDVIYIAIYKFSQHVTQYVNDETLEH